LLADLLQATDAPWWPQEHDEALEEFAEGVELGMYCSHCELWYRGQRRYHCQRCNKCCSGFDHHCPYLNQCICEENYQPFFLLVTAFLLQMQIAAISCVYCLWEIHRGYIFVGFFFVCCCFVPPAYFMPKSRSEADKRKRNRDKEMAGIDESEMEEEGCDPCWHSFGMMICWLFCSAVALTLVLVGAEAAFVDAVGDAPITNVKSNVESWWVVWLWTGLTSFLLLVSIGANFPIGVLWCFQYSMVREMAESGKVVSTLTRNHILYHDYSIRKRVTEVLMDYVPWSHLTDSNLMMRAVAQIRYRQASAPH